MRVAPLPLIPKGNRIAVVVAGSRLENLPLRDFLGNPTKIANALRQIRSTLKIDGLTCYSDPLLEVEALGGMEIRRVGDAHCSECRGH